MYQIIFIVQVLLLGSISFFIGCIERSEKETVQKISGNILTWNNFNNYINRFTYEDEELFVQYVPNDQTEKNR
ncbi:hypothetical protein ACUNWD_01230 [Sunxiuqinia sp. A32]|uniref:hypothetical protein n=1 Tax=Sunxiuqinia sp. A32 TaxID=3461496 RepID=UPI0040458230